MVERTGVIDDVVSGFYFFCFGKLGGHAAGDFFAGRFEIDILAGSEAGDALILAAGDDDQAVELVGCSGFEYERGFDDGDCAGVRATDLLPSTPVARAGRQDGRAG